MSQNSQNEQQGNVHYQIFKVDSEPHCVWDVKLREKNLEAINSIDPDYFLFLTDLYYSHLQTSNKDKAAMAIRTTYYHAAETLFSLIAATMQAPYCIYAWMLRYWPRHVRSVIEKFFANEFQPCLHQDFSGKVNTWQEFVSMVNFGGVLLDKDKGNITEHFARFWHQIGSDFLDDRYRNEYNSLKHGHRAMSGGFFVAFSNDADEQSKKLLGSEFGSSFLTTRDMGENNFYTRKFSLNWNPQGCAYALKLIAFSIHNIKSFLLFVNKAADKIEVKLPENLEEFSIPQKLQPQPAFIDIDFNINLSENHIISKKDMKERVSLD